MGRFYRPIFLKPERQAEQESSLHFFIDLFSQPLYPVLSDHCMIRMIKSWKNIFKGGSYAEKNVYTDGCFPVIHYGWRLCIQQQI
jgi:hypothetical protein